KVTGGAFYKGQQLWGKNEAAVQGELSLTQTDLSYQLDRNITLKGLDGSIPLAFYKGTLWPGEWPKHLERTLSFSSVEYAPFTLSSQTLAFSSAPNQLSV